MRVKNLAMEFVAAFVVSLVVTALVTFLWNLVGHGTTAADWETSFRFALILGIVLTWIKARETRKG
jgi:hypothetical protein